MRPRPAKGASGSEPRAGGSALSAPRSHARRPCSEPQADARRRHRRPSSMDGGDDLLGIDALQVDARRAEVGVAELALDDVERNAFARELERMSMAQLMGREPAPVARFGSEPANLDPDSGS